MLAVLAARAPRLRELDLSCTAAGAAPAHCVRALCARLGELHTLRLEGVRLGAAAIAELLGVTPPDAAAADAPCAVRPSAGGRARGATAPPAPSWDGAAASGHPAAGQGPRSAAAPPAAARGEGHAGLISCGGAWPPHSCGRLSGGPQESGPLAAAAPALRSLVLTGGAGAAAGAARRTSLPAEACGWLEREQWHAHCRALGASAAILRPGTRVGSFAVRLGLGGPRGPTLAGEDTDGHDPGGLTLYLVDGACPCAQPLRTLPGVADSGNAHIDATTMRGAPIRSPPREPRPRQPAALADLPHLAAFDERLRYSAAELLALRGAAAPGARPGCLAALPAVLLAGETSSG